MISVCDQLLGGRRPLGYPIAEASTLISLNHLLRGDDRSSTTECGNRRLSQIESFWVAFVPNRSLT